MTFQDKQGLTTILEVREGRVGDKKYTRPLRRGEDPEIRSDTPVEEEIVNEKNVTIERCSQKEEGEVPAPPVTTQAGFWGNIGNTLLNALAGPPLPGDSVYAFPGPSVGLPLYANFGLDPELTMALWGLNESRGGRWQGARRGP